MLKKYPRFILFLLFAVCLTGAGVFYFSNTQEISEIQTQTAQNLKLLNSHSHPEAGEKWVVFFETRGNTDLTITPRDLNSIDDLDFISLTCDGIEKTEDFSLQILAGDVIFYSDWECDGGGEVIHSVNIARRHTLKFQFGDKIAFAYNNPDSITDSFDAGNPGGDPEYYISSKENITVSGGQVYLATCKDNGAACSAGEECCSGNCQNSVCCEAGQTCCSSDEHCPEDSCLSACQARNNYCDGADHYCKYTDSNCSAATHCSAGSCVAGCCAFCKKCSGGNCVYQSSSEDVCNTCAAGACSQTCMVNSASGKSCNTVCAGYTKGSGFCNGSGGCGTTSCTCGHAGTDCYNGLRSYYSLEYSVCTTGSGGGCGNTMLDQPGDYSCSGYTTYWTKCGCE